MRLTYAPHYHAPSKKHKYKPHLQSVFAKSEIKRCKLLFVLKQS